ncbi:MAG: putative Na+/H+ antiporter [Burkholderiales bacterium]|jgi:NhaP-type Na+/H+ or K+/H+ antiporter|nr:putative Na+/H+ antiporter [Burkholderiales bacterium]
MATFFINNPQLIWPLILLAAWTFAEVGTYLVKIPKITFYTLFGFIFAKHQIGPLPTLDHSGIVALVNIIAGLILFDFGYRINLRWIWSNKIILITSIVESGVTFVVVFVISRLFDVSTLVSLEFAALFMATSPFVIINVINQQQSAGQVTERILHLTALNCISAIFIFKLILGYAVFEKSGSFGQATMASIVMLISSAALGIGFALFLFGALKQIKLLTSDRAVVLSLIIILLVGITKAFGLSPIIASLIFGLTIRHMKVVMGQNQRNFGALENILIIVLFIIIPVNLDWHNLSLFIGLGIALFLGRLIIKTTVVALFSYCNGVSINKGILTGLALSPISIFSILLLDQSVPSGMGLNYGLLMITGVTLLLELIGPCITQYALIMAKENTPT